MTNTTSTQTVQSAVAEVLRIKAPTKRAARIAELINELKTQAEVNEFTAELRRRAGVQDPTLLPSTQWEVRVSGRQVADHHVGTAVLRNTLEGAEYFAIDWPSVTFHWGVLVTFTNGGVHYVAYSADYQLTETYLSS